MPAPKVLYYSARGPDPEDSFLENAEILKPNLVAPGNSIWAAWSSRGTGLVEFLGSKSYCTQNYIVPVTLVVLHDNCIYWIYFLFFIFDKYLLDVADSIFQVRILP